MRNQSVCPEVWADATGFEVAAASFLNGFVSQKAVITPSKLPKVIYE